MAIDFKEIHIGSLIKQCVAEKGIELPRICNFFESTSAEINLMYEAKSLESDLLLRWSKLLEYDFFRIYSQHLILYAPVKNLGKQENTASILPQFRKNIYTREIIEFILEQISSKAMTKKEVMEIYRIPKTTLYKWIVKYK